MSFTLRDYQEDAVVQVRIAFRNGKKSVLLVLSTGAGKTVIFSYIAKSASDNGNNVLILAHRDQLIKQASNKLRDYGVKHGIIMAGFTPNLQAKAQIGSVQTLVRRLPGMEARRTAAAEKAKAAALAAGKSEAEAQAIFTKTKHANDPKLIVIDEAHLSAAKSYVDIVAFYPFAVVLGVTGSPCRLDGKPLGLGSGGLYDHMIQGVAISDLIRRGFLVKPRVFAPLEQLDLSGIRKSKGDFDTAQLAELVDKPKLTGSAVEHYRKICPDVPAVAWCVTIGHAQHVADAFNAAGIPAVMLCGEDDTTKRDAAMKGLEDGSIKVVTFVGILVEGVDCPAIGAILLLRPTMSLSSYLQVIGRGLRPFTNRLGVKKDCCYVLDHAGLTFRHGLADQEREWSLDGDVKPKKRKKKDDDEPVDVIQCKSCWGVFAPAPICPFCQAPVEVKVRKVEHVDGELGEITEDMAKAMAEQKKADAKREVKNAKSLEELEAIAAARGYSKGWAKHMLEGKQKTAAKYRPQARPPQPSAEELATMSLAQLERVANEQGWPNRWPSEFFHSQRELEGLPRPSDEALSAMTLAELEQVAAERGWPTTWPQQFHQSQQAQQQAPGGQ